MKHYLVCYDIADTKRLRKVKKIVYSYALSGQKSAVGAPLDRPLLRELTQRLDRVIDPEVDRINIIAYKNEPLCFGTARYLDENEGVIVL